MKNEFNKLIEQASLKKELVKILNSIGNKQVSALKLRDYIATKLIEIGYNGVDVFDVGISIGLKSHLYASIKIISVNIDAVKLKGLKYFSNEIKKYTSVKAKERFILFICRNNKADTTRLLKQIVENFKFIDTQCCRVFVAGPFIEKL